MIYHHGAAWWFILFSKTSNAAPHYLLFLSLSFRARSARNPFINKNFINPLCFEYYFINLQSYLEKFKF